MNFFKRFLCLALALAFTAALSLPVFAVGAAEQSDSEPRVLQVLIVDENGSQLYTGEEAERVFAELDSVQTTDAEEQAVVDAQQLSDDAVEPYGAFRYKYRFVPDSKDKTKVYGSYRIISDAIGNDTSLTQKLSFGISAKSSWSVNCKLTGKFKDTAEASIGGDWTKTYSGEATWEISVASKKRVWVQYRPEYILHSGKVQKYYKTRGMGITIVESSENVNIREAYERKLTLKNKTYKMPAGTYIWCEDNDYLSSKPPVVKK